MNVLITGSTGFIGRHIVTALTGKHILLTPTHKQLDLLDGDSVLLYFKKHKIDVVIHCAVVGGSGDTYYVKGMFYDNVRIFFNLVRCRDQFKWMINIGSGAMYDKRYPIVHVTEDTEKSIPTDEYGLYKYICAHYILTTKNITDLRVFGIFGKEEDYRFRFISNAICRYIHHMPIVLNQNVYFDYLYIGDFVNVIKHFVAHRPIYRAYNVGSGKKISLLNIATYVNTLDGYQVKIVVKKPGLNNEYTGNIDRLFNELPWLKPNPLQESIQYLFHWYKDNIRSIRRTEI